MLRLSPNEILAKQAAKQKEQRLQRLVQTREIEKQRALRVRNEVSNLRTSNQQRIHQEALVSAKSVWDGVVSV
jgi:hypothetical protein